MTTRIEDPAEAYDRAMVEYFDREDYTAYVQDRVMIEIPTTEVRDGIEVGTRVHRVGEEGEGSPVGIVERVIIAAVSVSFGGLPAMWIRRERLVPIRRLPLDEAWRAAMLDRAEAGHTGDVMTGIEPTTEFGQLGAECSAKPLIEVIREYAELSTQGDRGDHSGARRRTREFLWLEINCRLDRIRNYADEPSGRVVRQMLEGRP